MRKIVLLILLLFVDLAILQSSESKLRKKSLLLVADATGSMSDEIAQLRESCTTILNSFYSRKNKPIANYVLSLFRDVWESTDEFPPIINTTNPLIIQRELYSTKANGGGGDCPETPFTGIERALPYALPHSLIYVFTDAGSIDTKKTELKVKKILREKQIKVTFFLSHGACLSSEGDSLVYYRVAEETGGQVLKMEKKSVKDVLAAISVQLEDNYTQFETTIHNPGTHTENFDVGSEISKLVIIVQNNKSSTADNTTLSGIDPKNITHTSKPLGSNAQLLVVTDPSPGKWIFQSGSNSPYEKSMAGLSTVNFDYFFSLHKNPNKNEITYQPIRDMGNYLSISVSNSKEIKKLDKVILAFSDNSTQDCELFKENESLYITQPLSIPKKPFKINLFGINKENLEIRRTLSTTIEPIKLTEPIEQVHDIENLLKIWGLTNRVINQFKGSKITIESLKTISRATLSDILGEFPPSILTKVRHNIRLTFNNPNI